MNKLVVRIISLCMSILLVISVLPNYPVFAAEEIIEEIIESNEFAEDIEAIENIEKTESNEVLEEISIGDDIEIANADKGGLHEHECSYVSTNDGYHIKKCPVEGCGFTEIEECSFIADASDHNLKVCSRCKGVKPLYFIKDGVAQSLKLYNGDTGNIYLGVAPIDTKNGIYLYVKSNSVTYTNEDWSIGLSNFDSIVLREGSSYAGYVGTRAGDVNGMYNDTGEKEKTYVYDFDKRKEVVKPANLTKYSPYFGFSNLLNPSASGYSYNYDARFIDLKNFNTVVLEYESNLNYPFRTSFCDMSPYKTDVIEEPVPNPSQARKYKIRHYFDISPYSKGISSMPYPTGSLFIHAYPGKILFSENYNMYAINQDGAGSRYQFNARIDKELQDIKCAYNDVATFRVTGSNFCNSKWYYIKKGCDEPMFVTGNEDFVVDESEYATESILSIKANKETEGMQFYFSTKGYDDEEFIKSNAVGIEITNDPIVDVDISGFVMPVAGKPLDDLADIKLTTYRGNVINQKASISWKSLECLNADAPNIEPLQLASYNTRYEGKVAINTLANTESPFLEGEFNLNCNDKELSSDNYAISEDNHCLDVTIKSESLTNKYPVGELKDIIVDVNMDVESEVSFSLDQILDRIGAAFDREQINKLTTEYIVTNQNRFVLDDKEILENNIKLSGMATRPGTVYEASFKIESRLYEDAIFNLIVVSKEQGVSGRYHELLSPGVYNLGNNEEIRGWNELLNDGAIDCSGSILYELEDDFFDEKGYLIISRKINRIRKDAFANSKLRVLQFGNAITQIGTNALSGITDVYYEGTIKEWNELMGKSSKPVSKDNFRVHFIDYKKPVISIRADNKVYDGDEKYVDDLEVYVSENLNYSYNVSLGKLMDEKSKTVYKLSPDEYEVSYKNNVDAGTALVCVSAKDGTYEESVGFEIKKAPIVHFNDSDYYKKVKTFTQFSEKFYLYDQLPGDAGSASFEKKIIHQSEAVTEDINTKGLLSLSGFSYNTGSLYKAEFVIHSKNYEDKSFILELEGSSISEDLYAEYRGKDYTFEEALSKNLIAVNDRGYITDINPALSKSLSIPDYVDTDSYRGYINGFDNIHINSHSLEIIAMDNNRHIKELPDRLFEDNPIIECVILPEGMEAIGEAAFAKCQSLRMVYIPASIEYIGRSAFMNDISLYPNGDKNYSVRIPEGSLNTIEDGVFSGCKNLSSQKNPFIIPNNITTIKGNAFNAVEYLCYEGEKGYLEDMIWDSVSGKNRTLFNYRGQRITYPYSLKEIELAGDGDGSYQYKNSECRPSFIVWTDAGYYYTYALDGESLCVDEVLSDDTEHRYLCAGAGYNTVYKNNESVGEAKIIVSAAGRYHGYLENTFEIVKGNLADYIPSDIVVDLYSLNENGVVNINCDKGVYAKEVELGNIDALEFTNIKMDRESDYEIKKNGEVKLRLSYCASKDVIDKPLSVFSCDCLLKSENFEDYRFSINYNMNVARCEVNSAVYTGKPQTPSVKVWFNNVLAMSGIDYSCSYYDNVDKGIGRVLLIGTGRVSGEKELTFNIENGDASNVLQENDAESNGIKNAVIDFEYDEAGVLVYKVDEKVGCLIDLSDDSYDMSDYLPSDMGKVKISLLNLESDEEVINVVKAKDGLLEISGYCEYPTAKILKAVYGVDSSNYGFFKVNFSISSVRPITTNTKKIINTNVGLYSESLNLSDNMSDKVIPATIRKVYSGGSYGESIIFEDKVLKLTGMTQESGRIFYGSYAGRDKKYQSYRVNVSIDAINPNVSTVDVVKRELKDGFTAKMIEGYLYEVTAIKPIIEVYDASGSRLEYKKDYTLKYRNNKNANISPLDSGDNIRIGEKNPQIIIKYKGSYKNKLPDTVNFYIMQRDLSTFEIVYGNKKTLMKNAPIYSDKVIKKLLDQRKKAVKKQDYTVSYVNQKETNNIQQTNSASAIKHSEDGKYEIIVTGKNNYCGQLRGEFYIR